MRRTREQKNKLWPMNPKELNGRPSFIFDIDFSKSPCLEPFTFNRIYMNENREYPIVVHDPLEGCSEESFEFVRPQYSEDHNIIAELFFGTPTEGKLKGISEYSEQLDNIGALYDSPILEESKTPLVISDMFGNLIKRPINPEDDCC